MVTEIKSSHEGATKILEQNTNQIHFKQWMRHQRKPWLPISSFALLTPLLSSWFEKHEHAALSLLTSPCRISVYWGQISSVELPTCKVAWCSFKGFFFGNGFICFKIVKFNKLHQAYVSLVGHWASQNNVVPTRAWLVGCCIHWRCFSLYVTEKNKKAHCRWEQ